MPKTPRELSYALAKKIGGERGERLRREAAKKTPLDRFFDRELSNEEVESSLKKIKSLSKSDAQWIPVPGDLSAGPN